MKLKYEELTTHAIYRIAGDKYKEWNGMEFMIIEFMGTPDSKFIKVEPINDHEFKDSFETLYERSAIATECNFEEIANKETHPEYFL